MVEILRQSLPSSGAELRYDALGNQLDIEANFTVHSKPNDCQFGVQLLADDGGNATSVVFDFARENQTIAPLNTHAVIWIDMTKSGSNVSKGRTCAPVMMGQPLTKAGGGTRLASTTFTVRVLLDRSVIEVYSQEGVAVLSSLVFPPTTGGGTDVVFFAAGIDVELSARAYAMGTAFL